MQTIKSIVEKYTVQIQTALTKEVRRAVDAAVAKLDVRDVSGNGRHLRLTGKVVLPKRSLQSKKTKPAAKVAVKAGKPAKRIRRTPSDITDDRNTVLAHIKANPGQRAEVIKAALKMTKKDWLLPITQLVKSGSVTTKGQKRATEYFAA